MIFPINYSYKLFSMKIIPLIALCIFSLCSCSSNIEPILELNYDRMPNEMAQKRGVFEKNILQPGH